MNFDTSKNLAGIGTILLFIGVLPYANTFFALPIVGFILMLIGLKGLSEYYNESGIFNNFLYGIIVAVVGVVVAAAIAITAFLGFISIIVPNWNGDWTTLISQLGNVNIDTNIATNEVLPYVGLLLLDWVLLFVFTLIFVLLFRRSTNQLTKKSSVGLFGSIGTVLLVGGVLSILAIGYLLIWIALLLFAIAVFQVKEPIPLQNPQVITYDNQPN
jgi:uncharacterized membrane protein